MSNEYKQFNLKQPKLDPYGAMKTSFFSGALSHNVDFQKSRIQNIKNAPVIREFKCGESISFGNTVSLSDSGSGLSYGSLDITTSELHRIRNTDHTATRFTTSDSATTIEKVLIQTKNGAGSSTGSLTMRIQIQASDGTSPDGSDLVNETLSVSWTANEQKTFTHTFSSPPSVTPSNDYFVIISLTTDPAQSIYHSGSTTNTNGDRKSSNSGVSWGASSGNFATVVYEKVLNTGTLFKASAIDSNNFRFNGYIGISQGNAKKDDIVKVTINGVSKIDNLSAGSVYYLSDTFGSISTSAGTNSLLVGKALTEKELVIINI